MLITKEVQLELQRIDIQENPLNNRGNYACFQFAMVSPSSHYFFKPPGKVGDEDFSAVWGHSPTITFYTKDFKDWRNLVLDKIKADLPTGTTGPIQMQHVSHWHLAISNYDTPRGQRPWAIYYSAETFYNADRVKQSCQRYIPVDADFMSRIVGRLPIHYVQEKAA